MATWVSYAQNFEDVILRRVFADVSEGFYVDVGAQHPIRDSVTRAFYERGWRGINVEPVTEWNAQLQLDRPEDVNLEIALGEEPGSVTFYEVVGTGLSTSDADIAARHLRDGREVTRRSVPIETLDAVLSQHAADEIHFLKIDVEGFEARVLNGISLDRFRPWVVLVEATVPNSRVDSSSVWEPVLLNGGYRHVYSDGLNRFYLADEHSELSGHFAFPPNIFDDFVRYDDWRRGEDARKLESERDELTFQLATADEHAHYLANRLRRAEERQRLVRPLERKLAKASTQNARLTRELTAIKRSTSWRLTKPVRALSRLLHHVAPGRRSQPALRPVPDEGRLIELASGTRRHV